MNFNYIKQIIGFFLGVILTLLLIYFFKNFTREDNKTDYYILTNQISKMNKMVVLEQDFSRIRKTKISSNLLGIPSLNISEKEMVIFTKSKAQVSYNLHQMKIEVDSVEKKLIIKKIPTAEIKVFTDAEITSIDDSFLNRFSEDDFKRITNKAKEEAQVSIDKQKLRNEGRKQLLVNLNEIFVLANALNYKIIDDTKTLNFQNL